MKKIFFPIIFLSIFFFILVNAQEVKIDIEHIGFGKTVNEAVFTIHNTGSVQIKDINITVDGNFREQIKAVLPPGQGFKTSIFLSPGEHLIELITPEGAYDSLTLRISSAQIRPTIPQDEEPTIPRHITIYTALGVVIIIFAVVVWLLIRKPKPRLEQAR